MGGDPRRNAEGYLDLTAYEALKNIEKSKHADDEYVRFQTLLHTIFRLCKIAGFQIEGRIVLRDKRSGRVWR